MKETAATLSHATMARSGRAGCRAATWTGDAWFAYALRWNFLLKLTDEELAQCGCSGWQSIRATRAARFGRTVTENGSREALVPHAYDRSVSSSTIPPRGAPVAGCCLQHRVPELDLVA